MNRNDNTITPANLGWMAAVFDLKYCLVIKNNASRATPQLVFQVTTHDEVIIENLSRLTGIVPGHSSRKSFNQKRCKQHCPEAHIHVSGDDDHPYGAPGFPAMHTWAVTGVSAGIILHNVLPYMVRMEDKELTQLMNASLSNATYWGRGSGQTKEAIKRLVDLGWNLPPIVLNNVMPSDVEGGRAKGSTLACGHEKFMQPLPVPGTRVWCQYCVSNKLVIGLPRKRHHDH